MYIYTHKFTYIYTHTYIHTYVRTYIHTYIYIYTSKHIHKYIYIHVCSRIELKMTETETKQLQRSVSTFAMQLALRLCFCQMPNASITKVVSSETLKCSGGVTRQIHPTRPSVKLAQGKGITGVVGGRTPLYTRKSAATTWLERTLGGVIVGLTTF